MPKTIRIQDETFGRLKALGEGFRSDPLGTPDKVIQMLLDDYEENNPPPDEHEPVQTRGADDGSSRVS